MYPRDVKIVPYKINMYDKHGHFRLHNDTPDQGLIGTILVSLHETNFDYVHLKIHSRKNDETEEWAPVEPCYIMFYNDFPHEVLKQEFDFIRAIVSFKVYGNSDAEIQYKSHDQLILEIKDLYWNMNIPWTHMN